MVTATFRFHHELNDFLLPRRREREFSAACARQATTKHMIEALGVPHTEVGLITVQGQVAGFEQLLQDGDHVAVYPHSGSPDTAPASRLQAWPLEEKRFIADAHLGGLARLLRMAGFDTLYRNDLQDREIADIALREHRIVLTRDRDLLMLRDIAHGCYVHALKPEQQFVEIMARLALSSGVHPSRSAWNATRPCRPSPSHRCCHGYRPSFKPVRSTSPTARCVIASIGKARIGNACSSCWTLQSSKRIAVSFSCAATRPTAVPVNRAPGSKAARWRRCCWAGGPHGWR